jgi:hypothetical protein
MILPWDVSITRRNYFVLVAFLQLIIVDNSGAAMAQNFNEGNRQQQLQQILPSPQTQTPNFNVGRSNQTSAAQIRRKVHRYKVQQSPAAK